MERFPYNTPVDYLPAERPLHDAQTNNSKVVYAKLLATDRLAPTIARFRFSVSNSEPSVRWMPGQYVALAFEDKLSAGYSYMRDDDLKGLNDDYVRTFTVLSSPDTFLKNNIELKAPVKGLGGSFTIQQGPKNIVPIVADGMGITPLLAQVHDLDLTRIHVFWTVSTHDIR